MDRAGDLVRYANAFGGFALRAMRRVQQSAESFINRFCVIVPNPKRQITMETEFIGADFKLVRRDDDVLEQQDGSTRPFSIGHEEYQATPATFRFLELEDQSSDAARNLQAKAELMGEAFQHGKVGLAFTPARENSRAFDGQDLYDTQHTHVGEKTEWSNILPISWSSLADPTYDDLIRTLSAVRARLVANRAFGAMQLVSATELNKRIGIVVHKPEQFAKFDVLSSIKTLNGTDNPLASTFDVYLDLKGGNSDSFEVFFEGEGRSTGRIESTPKGDRLRITQPKPLIWIPTADPTRAVYDPSHASKSTFSLHLFGVFGYAAGWPSMTLRVVPSQA